MSMGGGKSSGGGADAGPMLDYSNKALDLQKKMYNQTMAMAQPYYAAGTSALDELMNRLGLSSSYKASATPTQQQITSGLKGFWSSTDPQYQNRAIYYNPATGEGSWDGGPGMVYIANSYSGNGDAATRQAARDQAYADAASRLASENVATTDENTGSLLDTFDLSKFQESPSYQFRLSEGNKALERALASRGQFTSMNPAAAKALLGYGQNMASEEYQNAYNNYNNDQNTIFNRLATISGYGTTATNQTSQAGQNYANQATDLYTGMGNAIVAANQANAANSGSMFNNMFGLGSSLLGWGGNPSASLFGYNLW